MAVLFFVFYSTAALFLGCSISVQTTCLAPQHYNHKHILTGTIDQLWTSGAVVVVTD